MDLIPSTLRLLDGEAESFAVDHQELGASFASFACAVRAGEPIDLAAHGSSDNAETWSECGPRYTDSGLPAWSMAAEMSSAVRNELAGSVAQDWRYLSALAALAGEIEQAMA